MPLAIELAAARTRSLSPADLAQRLDDRFRLLRGSGRGGVERHQTLRATIDWSYRLLDDSEQLLFDRLSVFAGSFDLAAVEAVCGDGEDLDPLDVLDGLSALVDKSLVVTDHQARPARYRLLETLRQYGAERLDERGETDLLRGRHLAHYVDVAEAARAAFQGDDPHGGVARFDANWDNLRAALGWAVATDDASAAEKLVRRAVLVRPVVHAPRARRLRPPSWSHHRHQPHGPRHRRPSSPASPATSRQRRPSPKPASPPPPMSPTLTRRPAGRR